jgi:hypothetical protein
MMAASLGACAATIMSKAAATSGFAGARPLRRTSLPFCVVELFTSLTILQLE